MRRTFCFGITLPAAALLANGLSARKPQPKDPEGPAARLSEAPEWARL
jgi:hypothetical protein